MAFMPLPWPKATWKRPFVSTAMASTTPRSPTNPVNGSHIPAKNVTAPSSMNMKHSIHGDALLTEGNPDVPTCIKCHGVHDINDPTTALARVRSPQLCADCHADEELMKNMKSPLMSLKPTSLTSTAQPCLFSNTRIRLLKPIRPFVTIVMACITSKRRRSARRHQGQPAGQMPGMSSRRHC